MRQLRSVERGAGHPLGATVDTAAGREVILKALSGVARTKGRVGKTVIAQMLTGSGSEKMDRLGLKRLSTFGILSDFRQPEVVQILDALDRAGLLESEEVGRFRPVVNLSERGWSLLRAQGPFEFALALPANLLAKIRDGGLERLAPQPAAEPRPGRPRRFLPGPRACARGRGRGAGDHFHPFAEGG